MSERQTDAAPDLAEAAAELLAAEDAYSQGQAPRSPPQSHR